MKKILFLLGLLLLFGNSAFANETNAETMRFVYINGSNNNTPAMEKWFYDGIYKLHPKMKNQFEQSVFVKEKLLSNGQIQIEKEPAIYFWGDKTLSDLQTVDDGLLTTSMISPKLAQVVRSLFAHCMHDAIWVQKPHNMRKIITDLHSQLKPYYDNGEKVVLFGYSAGSFVTYKYLFYKICGITSETIANRMKLTEEQKDFVTKNPIKPTCIDALLDTKLAVYSVTEELIPNPNFQQFKNAYLSLDQNTKNVCVPDKSLAGIVNYASPIVLFYSEIKDPTLEINKYNADLFKDMKNSDVFWITVNFADDPLGYPLTKNLTPEEINEMHNINFDENGRGFFHDKSDIKSPATFLGAHTSYWKYAKKFSKAVVKAYEDGYKNFYPQNAEIKK